MANPEGLRARKKALTHDAIADTAITLFLTRGFDQVSVSEIAEAADVSKPTLFRYFATKDDLVLHRFKDHLGEAAGVVRERKGGISPVTALHRHFRSGLDNYEPVTGLNDHPEVVKFHRLVFETPSLAAGTSQYMLEDEALLADALGSDLSARLLAAQIMAVQRVLSRSNWLRIAEGRKARSIHAVAVKEADLAYAQLKSAERAANIMPPVGR